MPQTSVFCFAKSRTQAGYIVDQLRAASFSSDDISALLTDPPGDRGSAHVPHTKMPEGVIAGLGIGGALVATWLASSPAGRNALALVAGFLGNPAARILWTKADTILAPTIDRIFGTTTTNKAKGKKP